MNDRWTETLSDYLDGDMAATEARALERHLESCEECRVTLEQLRAVAHRARALVDPLAPDDLWAGIASRIGTAGSTSAAVRGGVLPLPFAARSISLPWAMAAGFALLLMGAGGAYFVLGSGARDSAVAVRAPMAASEGGVQYASFDADKVEGEIAQLQTALDKGRGRLDPKTVAVLEKNLTIIRSATVDARRALAQDPANRELQNYFAGAVERKLQLVRRAATMAGV